MLIHINLVFNLQISYNFVYLDPVPGKQTNSKGMRYFGPKVSLTDECVFTVRTSDCLCRFCNTQRASLSFLRPKKNDCVNRAGFKVRRCHADQHYSRFHRSKFLKRLAIPLKFGEEANPPLPHDTKR